MFPRFFELLNLAQDFKSILIFSHYPTPTWDGLHQRPYYSLNALNKKTNTSAMLRMWLHGWDPLVNVYKKLWKDPPCY